MNDNEATNNAIVMNSEALRPLMRSTSVGKKRRWSLDEVHVAPKV